MQPIFKNYFTIREYSEFTDQPTGNGIDQNGEICQMDKAQIYALASFAQEKLYQLGEAFGNDYTYFLVVRHQQPVSHHFNF